MTTQATTAVAVHRIDPDNPCEVDAVLDMDQLVWADDLRTPRGTALADTPSRAAWIARIDGEDAGIAASWDIELSLPATGGGGSLRPVEGLTWVGVHPDHRRKGVLTALIREHLRWTRDEQGRSISVLKASEPGIYGRFGYGVAGTQLRSTVAAGTRFAAPPAVREVADATTLRTTTASPDQAGRWHALARECARTAAGHVVRSRQDCERLLVDHPENRMDREPPRLLWATRDGRDVGVAYFQRTPKWTKGNAEGRVGTFFLIAADTGARLALAERLVNLDLMTTTEYWLTPDDALTLWLPSPRTLGGSGMTDDLWLRIVDLPVAVAERGHAADVDLVVEVTDTILADNAGTWWWTASGGAGSLTRGDEAADLTLDIRDLGAVWLGGQTLAARAAAGFVTEHRAGAVAELDAALRTGLGPVGAIDF